MTIKKDRGEFMKLGGRREAMRVRSEWGMIRKSIEGVKA
jgi:hypothetical protein